MSDNTRALMIAFLSAQQESTARLLAELAADAPAVQAPVSPVTAAPAPPAEVKYRSAKAIAKGHDAEAEIYARYKAAAGVKRFKDLDAQAQKACKAEVRALWAGLKGTRKTPVA